MAEQAPRILYSDVGGVLATNGWDSDLRRKVAEKFQLDQREMDSRHHLAFDTFEIGKMSFEQYLGYVVFYTQRPFSVETVRDFVYEQSRLFPDVVSLFRQVKQNHRMKLALISNEGPGLTSHRVTKFNLGELADFMVFSSVVGYRKPDLDIWKLALALAQMTPGESLYIDDRQLFVDIARQMGFRAFQHRSLEETRQEFRKLGLAVD